MEKRILENLIGAATGAIPHVYMGACPDALEGPDARDTECPACQAIMAAEQGLAKEKLIRSSHGKALSAEHEGKLLTRMQSEPFKLGTLVSLLCGEGIDGCYGYDFAEILIRREKLAGNIAFKGAKWHWIASATA